jgi:hypothetical protein
MPKLVQRLQKELSYAGKNNITFHFHPSDAKEYADSIQALLRNFEGQARTIATLMENTCPNCAEKCSLVEADMFDMA